MAFLSGIKSKKWRFFFSRMNDRVCSKLCWWTVIPILIGFTVVELLSIIRTLYIWLSLNTQTFPCWLFIRTFAILPFTIFHYFTFHILLYAIRYSMGDGGDRFTLASNLQIGARSTYIYVCILYTQIYTLHWQKYEQCDEPKQEHRRVPCRTV